MQISFVRIAIAVLPAIAAIAQSPAPGQDSRVLNFRYVEAAPELQEIATLVRSSTEMKDTFLDSEKRSISVTGTTEQVQLADWLVKELDKPAETLPASSSKSLAKQYIAGKDDLVRLFHIQNAKTAQDFQEMATVLRSLAETRRTFTVNAQRVIAVRGTSEQIRLSEWLLNQLDQPAVSQPAGAADPAVRAYTMSAPAPENPRIPPDNDVRIFFLTHAGSVQEFQEIVSLMRSITETRRVFTINAQHAVAVRGSSAQIALNEWLYHELNNAASAQALASRNPGAATHEYQIPGDTEGTTRVFYLPAGAKADEVQRVASVIRANTKIRRTSTYNAPGAIVVRGTPSEVAAAEQMVPKSRQ